MKIPLYFLITLFIFSPVFATTTTLTPDVVSMDSFDQKIISFCMFQNNLPVSIQVTKGLVCQELDGIFGCSSGDKYSSLGFSVTHLSSFTDNNGCTDILLESQDIAGSFRFTINGFNGFSVIGAESGRANVFPSKRESTNSCIKKHNNLVFRSLRFEGDDFSLVQRGDDLWVVAVVQNHASFNINNVQIRFFDPNIGLIVSAKHNIKAHGKHTFYFLVPVPSNTPINWYYPSLTIESDCSFPRSKNLFLEII